MFYTIFLSGRTILTGSHVYGLGAYTKAFENFQATVVTQQYTVDGAALCEV